MYAARGVNRLTGPGIEQETIADRLTIAVQVPENSHVALQGDGGYGLVLASGTFADSALETKNGRCIEIGKPRQALLIHPADEHAQMIEVDLHGARPLRQTPCK